MEKKRSCSASATRCQKRSCSASPTRCHSFFAYVNHHIIDIIVWFVIHGDLQCNRRTSVNTQKILRHTCYHLSTKYPLLFVFTPCLAQKMRNDNELQAKIYNFVNRRNINICYVKKVMKTEDMRIVVTLLENCKDINILTFYGCGPVIKEVMSCLNAKIVRFYHVNASSLCIGPSRKMEKLYFCMGRVGKISFQGHLKALLHGEFNSINLRDFHHGHNDNDPPFMKLCLDDNRELRPMKVGRTICDLSGVPCITNEKPVGVRSLQLPTYCKSPSALAHFAQMMANLTMLSLTCAQLAALPPGAFPCLRTLKLIDDGYRYDRVHFKSEFKLLTEIVIELLSYMKLTFEVDEGNLVPKLKRIVMFQRRTRDYDEQTYKMAPQMFDLCPQRKEIDIVNQDNKKIPLTTK